MKRRRLIIITACVCCLALSVCADTADGGGRKGPKDQKVPSSDMEVVEALLKRSRLLENVHFRVPRRLWAQYVRSLGAPKPSLAPVGAIAAKGLYSLAVEAGGTVTLEAEVHLRVFRPNAAANSAVLTDDVAWTDVRVARNGEKPAPIDLVRSEGWMRYSPAAAGMHVIHARAKLSGRHGEGLPLPVGRTVRTLVAFDSDRVLHVTDPSAPQSVTGAEGRGTRGVLALKQTARLDVTYRPPVVLTEREARYQLSGPVAWNIDAGGQDVAAKLNVAILAGRTDRLDLDLPPGATRPTVTGPDVRETRVAAAGVTVHLRGRITGKTALTVKFALPDAGKDAAALAGLGVRNGRWAGGTLVVTNSAGSREIMPAAASGLAELALADVPRDAAANGRIVNPAHFGVVSDQNGISVSPDGPSLGQRLLHRDDTGLHYAAAVALAVEDAEQAALDQVVAGGFGLALHPLERHPAQRVKPVDRPGEASNEFGLAVVALDVGQLVQHHPAAVGGPVSRLGRQEQLGSPRAPDQLPDRRGAFSQDRHRQASQRQKDRALNGCVQQGGQPSPRPQAKCFAVNHVYSPFLRASWISSAKRRSSSSDMSVPRWAR